MTWPAQSTPVAVRHSFDFFGGAPGSVINTRLIGATSATYSATNLAIYAPFYVGSPLTVRKMFTWNGAVASGNIDVGIYAVDGTRLVSSGSTAQAGTNVLQVFDVADTVIGPGNYYFAIAKDDVTGTLMRSGTITRLLIGLGCLNEPTTGFPLPTTATFGAVGFSYLPVFGFTTQTVI